MSNRVLDWIVAALLLAAMACAGASPVPTEELPAAYRAALECPQWDCGEE